MEHHGKICRFGNFHLLFENPHLIIKWCIDRFIESDLSHCKYTRMFCGVLHLFQGLFFIYFTHVVRVESYRIISMINIFRREFPGKEVHHHPFLDVIGLTVSVNIDKDLLIAFHNVLRYNVI